MGSTTTAPQGIGQVSNILSGMPAAGTGGGIGGTLPVQQTQASGLMNPDLWQIQVPAAASMLSKAFNAGMQSYYGTGTAQSAALTAATQASAQADAVGYQAQIYNAQTRLANATATSQAALAASQARIQGKAAGTMADTLRSQAAIAGYQAETVRANKVLQDIHDRQQLEQIGRQQSSLTAGYKELRGSNTVQAAAGNVDVASGSAAKVQEGNAARYAADEAAIRQAYLLQQWSNESQLAMMDVQASGYDQAAALYGRTAKRYGKLTGMYNKAAKNYGKIARDYTRTNSQIAKEYTKNAKQIARNYSKISSSYKSVANMYGSPIGNALLSGAASFATSFLSSGVSFFGGGGGGGTNLMGNPSDLAAAIK